jgi:hypothetical protein
MAHVLSVEHALFVRSWQGVTPMHTGITRLGFSAIGFFAQYVSAGQSSKSPQQ